MKKVILSAILIATTSVASKAQSIVKNYSVPGDSIVISIPETAPVNTRLFYVDGQDPDATDILTIAASGKPNVVQFYNGGGMGVVDKSTGDSTIAELRLTQALNYSTNSEYTFQIKLNDDAGLSSAYIPIRMIVENVNLWDTILSVAGSPLAIDENTIGSFGNFTFEYDGSTQYLNDLTSYEILLADGTPTNDFTLTSFNNTQAKLENTATFDFESQTGPIALMIRAEKGNDIFELPVSVSINDVNEAPSAIYFRL